MNTPPQQGIPPRRRRDSLHPHARIALLRLALVIAAIGTAVAAQQPSLGFSHDDWTTVLSRFVDERGRVSYEGLATDRTVLDRYIQAIESVSPDTHPERFPTRDEQLAYFINAYNAQVIRLVLERGPEKTSVWRGLVSGLKFFVRTTFQSGGKTTNLKALEDDIIRGRYRDPRIHAALNCASVGCPRLPRKAFAGATLNAELDAAMQEFVRDSRHVDVEPKRAVVRLSKIFDWFAKDFEEAEAAKGNAGGTVLEYINRYRGDRPISEALEIEYIPYDKGLNKQ